MNISISRIKAFKSCRRLYELRYVEHLEPTSYPEALEVGKTYHALIDAYYKGEEMDAGYTKEAAMFAAYKKYIAPNFRVVESEKKYELDLPNGDTFVGIVDGIAEDGYIVEHKTTGSDITEQYEYNLQWDEQILAYMLLSKRAKVWYTVCRKPTIRQKQNETDEEFYNRMVDWYDDDTESKIRVIEITRTADEVIQFYDELKRMVEELHRVESTKHYYRNNCHCNLYGRRCEYSPVCLNYNPEENYIGFIKND